MKLNLQDTIKDFGIWNPRNEFKNALFQPFILYFCQKKFEGNDYYKMVLKRQSYHMENGTILSMNFTRGKNKTLEHPEIFMMACCLIDNWFQRPSFC